MTSTLAITDLENTPTTSAYVRLGQLLWTTLARKNNVEREAPESLNALMRAMGEANAVGSVCFELHDEDPLLPVTREDIEMLVSTGIIGDKNQVSETTPIVADFQEGFVRLYLQRRFQEEVSVAQTLWALAQQPDTALTTEQEQTLAQFDRMSYGKNSVSDDRSRQEQLDAVRGAVLKRFCIITGGPGTGKTTTVAKIIECLLSDKPDLTLKLAAPTGKATARIMQSLEESALRFEPFFPRLVQKLKESELPSRTIHKWLVTPTATGRAPSADNPIDCDVLIIDEASMIDISLAKELLDVIDTSRTRLILLGDKHQLSAVGPGSVLADLTVKDGAISQCVKELTVSHRFTADSNVGQMAYAINSADDAFEVNTFINRFADSRDGKDAVSVHVPTENTAPLSEAFLDWIRPHMQAYIESLNAYLTLPDQKHLEALWEAIDRFRVFAAQRQGPMSVSAVNAWAEDYVKRALGVVDETIFYPGRLIIIRVNSSDLDVYNGDVGIVIPKENQKDLMLYIGDRRKWLSVGLLPQHDTAFAMTIHQSQGSQFKHVAVILPSSIDSGLATRELFYTGVTRAQAEAAVFGTEEIIEASCTHGCERASGLADRLKELS